MKTNFWKSAAAFIVGMAALVACQKETILPVFPDKVITNSNVTTTAETIKFTANLDWKLSVPQETISFFWFEGEDGNPKNFIEGKAGDVSVNICITDTPDFDKDITCDVTLKMGEESKVVATYTLLKSVKEFKAYANAIEDGALNWRDEGGFEYEEQATTEETLVYNETYGFVMPFIFDAGFNYDVECPEWMDVEVNAVSEIPVGKRGVCEVLVSADLNKLSAEVTSGDLKIKVRNTDEVVSTVKINIPSLDDFVLSEMATVSIGIDGKYRGELDACTFNVKTGSELTFVLAGMENNGWWATSFNEDPSYKYSVATLTVGEAVVTGLLKTCTLSVAFTPNDAAERKAYLLAMPASEAAKFDNWAANEAAMNDPLNEDYKQYVITTFTQEGVKELFTIEGAQYEPMPEYSDFYPFIVEKFGEVPAYIINATQEFTVLSTEFANVKFYNDGLQESEELFELNMVEGETIQWKISATEETYGFIEFQKIEYIPNEDDPTNPTEVVTTVAVAWVEYSPSSTPVVEGAPFAFVSPTVVSGATLEKFSESGIELPGDLQYSGISQENIYVLTYSQEWPQMPSIIVPSMPDWGLAWGDPDDGSWWLTYELNEGTEDQIYVSMSEAGKVDFFTFNNKTYALICTRTN